MTKARKGRTRRRPQPARPRPAAPSVPPQDKPATASPAGLSAEHVAKILDLGKMGPAIGPADVAKILDLQPATVQKFLESADGARLWARARAEGRAELLAVMRRQALEGSAQAQKLLAGLLDRDDTVALADQRIQAKEAAELLGRSKQAMAHRVTAGDYPPAGADGRYRVGDLIAWSATLWDRLAAVRHELDSLRKATEATRVEEAEARRLERLEIVRRRKRENDEAEGRLVPADDVRRTVERLGRTIREQSQNLVDTLALKCGLTGPALIHAQETRQAFLRRCAAEMDRPEEVA